MLRSSRSANTFCLAKLYSVPWETRHAGQRGHLGTSLHMTAAKRREGFIQGYAPVSELPLRKALQTFAAEPESRRRLTSLPGVEFESELPADPITRLFFQRKGDNALYEGENEHPHLVDHDRVALQRRGTKPHGGRTTDAIYDYCHRLREASQQMKRFVIVAADGETKAASEVLLRHGLIAGFRDFNNERAYAIELKYFQGESVINGIEPVSMDQEVEFEFTPKMMRRFMSSFGVTNKIRIFLVKTYDGRVIDHLKAVEEGIAGRGLFMVW